MSKDLVKNDNQSPATLIEKAIAGGANLEQLEKLMILKERYEANEARKAYHVAMADFKASVPKVIRDKVNSQYKSKYVSLSNLVNTINPALSKCGFSANWDIEQKDSIKVTCRVSHVLGHSETSSMSAEADTSGSKNAIQQKKSTVTYLKSVTFESILGLASTDANLDDDGNMSNVAFIDEKQLNNIVDLLASLDVGQAKFCKFMKVEKLEDIPASDYQKAIVSLDAKMVATQRKEGQKK